MNDCTISSAEIQEIDMNTRSKNDYRHKLHKKYMDALVDILRDFYCGYRKYCSVLVFYGLCS